MREGWTRRATAGYRGQSEQQRIQLGDAGPDAIHNYTNQGQAFGFFTYSLNATTRLSLITSMAASDNQLPNQNQSYSAVSARGGD